MTDNRTNVQIVADALRSMPEAERDDDRDPAVVVAEYAVAALVAAQGAAPVAADLPAIDPPLHPDEREPIALNPLLRGVDLALDRLIRRDCFSERTLRVIDELRDELAHQVLLSSTESPVEPFKTWFACWWKNEPNAIAESNAQSAFYAGWDARGLPSSGVDEERAEAVRETARYIDRIAPNGLVPKMMILADMEIAADRLGRGIHANGRDREQGGESRGER